MDLGLGLDGLCISCPITGATRLVINAACVGVFAMLGDVILGLYVL